MIEIQLNNGELNATLQRLARSAANLGPVMHAIAEELQSQTIANFQAQGRPRWAPLQNPGDKRKDGQILQDSGQLAASITADSGRDYAVVGSNKPYAAIHQLGGKTKAHTIRPKEKKALAFGGAVVRGVEHPGSDIPARPFLPITAAGELQTEAQSDVLDIVLEHLEAAARDAGAR